MSALDSVANFIEVQASTGYNSSATAITLQSGQGSKLPAAPFNMIWWNSTDYPNPANDPNVEIVRVTNVSTDTLTITRAQESTTASNKNTAAKTYNLVLGITAKMVTDLAAQTGNGVPVENESRQRLRNLLDARQHAGIRLRKTLGKRRAINPRRGKRLHDILCYNYDSEQLFVRFANRGLPQMMYEKISRLGYLIFPR